jgi:hypothetical protein
MPHCSHRLQQRLRGFWTKHLYSRTSAGFGVGVLGASTHSTNGYGLWGDTTGTAGAGVVGVASSTGSGLSRGVLGICRSSQGTALLGTNEATTGPALGLRGESYSTSGYALSGFASATTGTNFGMASHTASPNGYSVYATGGRNYFEGNLGVGTYQPAAKLHVIGTIRVEQLAATTTATRGALGVDSTNGNISSRSFGVGNGAKEFAGAGSTYTWTAPAGITKVKVRAWGGGAGAITGGGGGASGGYVEAYVSVVPGTAYTVYVGNGGSPNANGEATTLKDGTVAMITANGGTGYTGGFGVVNSMYADPAASIATAGNYSASTYVNRCAPPAYLGRIVNLLQGDIGVPISVGSGGAMFGSAQAGWQGALVLEW